jgi:hypothetical protein
VYAELFKALIGLAIVALHIPLADFITERDRELVSLFRRRGVNMPEGLSREHTRTLMFCMGALVAVVQLTRLWMMP